MNSRLKQALLEGARDALAAHGLAPEHEESLFHKALPWLAAGGAGLAGYKFLRTPSFSKNPALRALQQRAATKGFHRIVDVTPKSLEAGAGVGERVKHWLHPRASPDGKLDLANRLKLLMQEGTTEAIPLADIKGRPRVIGGKGPRNIEGVVHGRHDEHGRASQVRGGEDIEGPLDTQRALTRLSRGGKRQEAELLKKHIPDAIPETHTDLKHLFQGLSKDRRTAITELQGRVLSNHGHDVALKPSYGLASGGKFPHAAGDWGAHLDAYDAHMADPASRKAFNAAKREGQNAHTQYMIDHGLYEGHTLHNALKNPNDVILQKWIDQPLGEWRVHSIAGSVPSELIMPRHLKGPADVLRGLPGVPHGQGQMRDWVENEVLAMLPKKYREGNFAFDVMPHRNPDGSIGFKILEVNPTERATATEGGASSGLLDPSRNPFVGHKHYRAATGRQTPLKARLPNER